MMKKTILAAAALSASLAFAGTVPVNVGLWDPVQTADAADAVHGFQLGLFWDRSAEFYGLTISVGGNIDNGAFRGLAVAGGFNWIDGDGFGATGAIGFNRVGGSFGGLQWAYGANLCHGDFYGFQDACSNYANRLHGVQFGLVNMSHDVHGLQVGVINTAEEMSGVQVGILNFIRNSKLPFFPIVNAKF